LSAKIVNGRTLEQFGIDEERTWVNAMFIGSPIRTDTVSTSKIKKGG
jgi:hypothetical protein